MPLLSFFLPVVVLLAVLLLSACHNPVSHFFATGYVADQGIIRIWRYDEAQQPKVLMSVYSPLDKQRSTMVSYYEYQQGELYQLRQTISCGEKVETLQIRMDGQGEVVFMQRQQGDWQFALSPDDIARSRYQSQHELSLSTALRAGNVRLHQGRWERGQFVSCAGKIQPLKLESRQLQRITQRADKIQRPLGIAWLEAPEGTQLLLVADEDFCFWEPTRETLWLGG